jgi:hypothetical protein
LPYATAGIYSVVSGAVPAWPPLAVRAQQADQQVRVNLLLTCAKRPQRPPAVCVVLTSDWPIILIFSARAFLV